MVTHSRPSGSSDGLSHGLTDEFMQELLSAGRSDAIPEPSRQRILGHFGLAVPLFSDQAASPDQTGAPHQPELSYQPSGGGAASGGAASSGAASSGAASGGAVSGGAVSGGALVGKGVAAWATGGVLAAMAVWGGLQLGAPAQDAPQDLAPQHDAPDPVQQHEPTPSLQPEELVTGGRELAEPVASESEGAADEARPQDRRATKRSLKSSAAPRGDTLSRQLELIDQARGAMQRGDAARALRLVDTYRSQFPRGSLHAEATVLKVEALMAAGQRTRARQIAEAFLSKAPDSAYARRLRSLIE